MTQDEINAVKKAAEKMRKQESAQDEIIEMARQAGFMMENSAAIQAAEIFAKLVAAKALAQRTWVGLTKKEVHDLYDSDYVVFHQRIEAKLKDKNS